jgi:hypothetical protein
MNARLRLRLLLFSVGLCAAATVCAQGFLRGRIVQNDPPDTEFVAARWHFGTNGLIGHRGWSHNYPNSDRNLNDFLSRSTRLDVEEESYLIVELGSEEVFNYPFAYVSEPGEMELTDQEVENLREFAARGGFVLMDDFDGPVQWEQMNSQMMRAFPGSVFVPLTVEHPVFRAYAPPESLEAMAEHVPGGEITYFGLFDDADRLIVLAGLNNDLANFWDWYADGRMPLKPATDAFRVGTSAVLYSLTH